ncbi:MAG: hypothetical protein II649_04240 [Kiritimatiellae bacterium]|nr:hypothetical protein [Kiritimatiellia bacterium]
MNITPYENLTPEELKQNKVRLLRIPKSVSRIMLHIKAFHDNYGALCARRVLRTGLCPSPRERPQRGVFARLITTN